MQVSDLEVFRFNRRQLQYYIIRWACEKFVRKKEQPESHISFTKLYNSLKLKKVPKKTKLSLDKQLCKLYK